MIKLDKLCKSFGHKEVLHSISLQIDKPVVYGLIGPNGAGKTTTIRMLTMQTRKTAGDIKYNGISIEKNEKAIKAMIGVVPQHINFDMDLTVGQNMELHGRLHHMDKHQ